MDFHAGKIVQSTLEECREAYGMWIQMVSSFPLQIWQVLIKVKVLFKRACMTFFQAKEVLKQKLKEFEGSNVI